MRVRSHFIPSALIAVLAAGAAGCATAHAKAPPEIPPLEMPPPPQRLMAASDTDQPPPTGLIEEPARHAMPEVRRPAATAKPDAGREEMPRGESAAPPAPPEPAKPAEESKPSTTLQMPLSVSESEAERNIQALLTRASTDLNRVNQKSLNADAQAQYEMVQGYVRTANDALHQKNLVFAMKLAERAAVLAAQLARR